MLRETVPATALSGQLTTMHLSILIGGGQTARTLCLSLGESDGYIMIPNKDLAPKTSQTPHDPQLRITDPNMSIDSGRQDLEVGHFLVTQYFESLPTRALRNAQHTYAAIIVTNKKETPRHQKSHKVCKVCKGWNQRANNAVLFGMSHGYRPGYDISISGLVHSDDEAPNQLKPQEQVQEAGNSDLCKVDTASVDVLNNQGEKMPNDAMLIQKGGGWVPYPGG
ncbi:hypothetical protein QBC42DRAFT_344055 [Cladorrhinum samala]|uniref:Uncharacterized protein n=1 Tax=Cladorrhinum samala TaxID=585594 RepID=A0AAV9HW73_9PEZI|nr:hypothetical protein QBC42DRAFT_344055 [Cladorrhinum samala]